MAFPGMGIDTGESIFSERDRQRLVTTAEQERSRYDACVAAGRPPEECTAANRYGESATDEGSPSGILRDPWVQRGLALIVGAFVGGGIAYVVFGRKGE